MVKISTVWKFSGLGCYSKPTYNHKGGFTAFSECASNPPTQSAARHPKKFCRWRLELLERHSDIPQWLLHRIPTDKSHWAAGTEKFPCEPTIRHGVSLKPIFDSSEYKDRVLTGVNPIHKLSSISVYHISFYGLQCPYISNCVEQVTNYCTSHNIPLRLAAVDSLEKAKSLPCIFNNWAVFYNGQFETTHLLNETFLKKKFGV